MVLTSKTRLGKRKLEIKEVRKEKQEIASKKHDKKCFAPVVTCNKVAKCPSTWPAHFAAVTRQHYTASFTSKASQLFICLTDPAHHSP
jgi:hypothetical protein